MIDGPLGATGRFPQGKLNDDDEGEITIAVGTRDGTVVIEFGKPVKWIGFDVEQASLLAGMIMGHAHEVERQRGP